jgi:hypothetical protein
MPSEFHNISFLQSQHFSQRHGGLNSLIQLIEICNKETDLEKIGLRFHLSASQACRLRSGICENVWRPQRGTIEYIEFQIECLKREARDRGEFLNEIQEISKKAELHLIFGKDMKWIK